VPLINVSFIEGPDQAAQAALAEDLTNATVERFGVPREAVQVVLTPVPSRQWSVGGRMMDEVLGR
jgi:4-oxalocrotonate tautomerase family enzyme